jgi:RHS repeat-associated protein
LVRRKTTGQPVRVSYVWAGEIGGLPSRTVKGTPDVHYYYHYDGNGNVVQLTDASQNVAASYSYDAYGNVLASSGSQSGQPFRYSTKWCHGASGLYDYGFRFYSPGLGRWINRDPSREFGGANLYCFAANSPLNCFDDFGLGLGRALGGIGGSLLGAEFGPAGMAVGAGLGSFVGSLIDGDCASDAFKNALMDTSFALAGAGAGEIFAGLNELAQAGKSAAELQAVSPIILRTGWRPTAKAAIADLYDEFKASGGVLKLARDGNPTGGFGGYDSLTNTITLYKGSRLGTLAEELFHAQQARELRLVGQNIPSEVRELLEMDVVTRLEKIDKATPVL